MNKEQNTENKDLTANFGNTVLPAVFRFENFGLAGFTIFQNDKMYPTGCFNKSRVENLVNDLNNTHRPNLLNTDNGLMVCWNNHDKGEKCDYEPAFPMKTIFNKEQLWDAWWASAIKTISFTPIDKDYERRCFEDWFRKSF